MTAHPSRPIVGVLALTLEFYETLVPGLRASREEWLRREVLPELERTCGALFSRAVFRREDVDRTVASFEAEGADAILILLLTYAPSQVVLPALRRTRLPLAIWNTQELAAVDASFTPDLMIHNHGVHGTQDLSNVLARMEVPFHFVTGHARESAAWTDLNDFFFAAASASRVRAARLGLLGYPFPGMGDLAVDTTRLTGTLGCQWCSLSTEEYARRAAKASTDAVAALVAEYSQAYEVAADVTRADLEATARVEIALDGMVRDHRLDALTYQFLAFGEDERTPTLPFVAASRLMARGIGFGGEGDLVGALGTALLHWLQPPATFAEMFTIDFAGNSLFLSHNGRGKRGHG